MRFIKQGIVRNGHGDVIADATISVYLAGTTTVASVYAASTGGTAVNSVTSDSAGGFSFYVDEADYARTQLFKLVLAAGDTYTTQTWDDMIIMDASDISVNAVINSGTGVVGNIPIFDMATGKSITDSGIALSDYTVISEIDTGEIMVGSATGLAKALAAHTPATKRFLTATGTGAAGQDPAWDAIIAADIATALTTPGAIGGTTPADGSFTKVVVDNLTLDGNTLSSTSGDINITPLAGQDVVIDGHNEFDANAITGLTDNDTVIRAYSGKAVDVESVKFDGGVVSGATSISSTGFTGALTGNADTATALATARAIDGVNFNGTAPISLPRAIEVQVVDTATDVLNTHIAYWSVPLMLNGRSLTRAQARVITAGSTNATTVQIRNMTKYASNDALSGAISIASGGTLGTVGTINSSYDDVSTDDLIKITVPSVSDTPPKGLIVILEY